MDRPIPAVELRTLARRRWIGAAALGVTLTLLVVFLSGFVAPSIPRSHLRTARVERGAIDATLTASGLVLPEHEFVVTSPGPSRVLQALHQPGDTVAAGVPILQLDQGEARLTVERLERQVALKRNEREQARVELENHLNELTGQAAIKALELKSLEFDAERKRKLADAGVVSADDARKVEADLERCRIELEQLEASKRNAERGLQVRLKSLDLEHDILLREKRDAERTLQEGSAASTRAGVITWVQSGEGVSVARGDELARVADLSTFRVEGTLSDVHAGQVRAGLPAIVRTGDLKLRGRVSKVHPMVENGIVRIDVVLDQPDHPALRSNLRVEVDVITDHREGTLVVRRGGLVAIDGDQALFRIRGHEAERRRVKLGITNFESNEILEGLEEGDEVILSDMSDYANRKEIRIP